MMANDLPDFDPEFASPAEWAAMYRARGIQVVPARFPMRDRSDKRPALADWKQFQSELLPQARFDRWYGPDGEHRRTPNMGMITGAASGNRFIIDLDEQTHVEARAWWANLIADNCYGIEPETWAQRTGGGGRQICFEGPPGWKAPTCKTSIGVDIRGQGGFAMLPPSIHLSGKAYEWSPGSAPWEADIAQAPAWLIAAIEALVEEHGGDVSRGGVERQPAAGEFDAFGHRTDGREDYMTRLVWGAVVDWWRECPIPPTQDQSEARMREAYATYERNVQARGQHQGLNKAALLEREGRGASEFAKKWRIAVGKWAEEVAAAGSVARTPDEPFAGHAEASGDTLPLLPAFPIVPQQIPTRDWIIPGVLLRRYLSVLVAPPGSGKSLLTLQIGIAVAAGLSWGGWTVRERAKVLVVNAEDDADEMRRRLWASAQVMNVGQDQLAGNIFLAEAPESIVIARTDAKTRTVIRTPLVDTLVRTIEREGIGLIVVDPFAETFEGDENNNSEVKWAGILWREVARRTGAAVLLVHHTRKYASGMAGDADASRGGGALIGTARIVSTLFAMTEDEASTMSVPAEERTRYVRFDDAKANLSLVTGVARWFEKVSVTMPNGGDVLPGDEVGALAPWKPPGVFDGIASTTLRLVLETIDRGLTDDTGAPTGQLYTATARGADNTRWVGNLIQNMLGCDDARAKGVVRQWMGNGLLVPTEYLDPIQRKARTGVKTDRSKWPGGAS